LAELTTIIITSAIIIDRPSVRPSGNPSLATPIITETNAAAHNTIFIGSSKFSAINSKIVLIFGGGNAFTPY
jgi:hypothetical protein